MISEADARVLMAMPKFGDPPAAWMQHKTHRGLATLEFGVTDHSGASIPGMHVEIAMLQHQRIRATGWKLTLFVLDGYLPRRCFQQDHPGRAGVKLGDHDFPHEHVAEGRYGAEPSWCTLDFDGMLKRFCERTNLTIMGDIPDIHAFRLT